MADLFPVVSFPPKIESPVKVEAPTLFDTGRATMTELFGEPLRQTIDSARGPLEFDAEFDYRTFIRDEGLSGQVAQMVEKFGNTSRADAQYQVKVYRSRILPMVRTLQNSSVGAKIATDPITLATILIPMTAPMAIRAGARLLPTAPRARLVGDMNMLTTAPFTRNRIVKTVTAETAVFETVREASIALDAISEGEDPEDALLRGAAFIAGSTAAAALLGYGIGSFVNRNVQSPRVMEAAGSAEQINGTEIARPISREESLKSAQAATIGSKVTNTVYHGSGNTGITTFESSGYTKGLYFSPRSDLAEDYMIRRGDGAGRVYEVMLDIKNPLIIKGSGKSLMDRIDIALGRKSEKDVRREGDERLTSSMILSEERIQELRGRGYDGIMNEDAMEYVAFDASQVHMVGGRSYTYSTTGGKTVLVAVKDQEVAAPTVEVEAPTVELAVPRFDTPEIDPNIAQSPRVMEAAGSAAEGARQRVATFIRPLAEWINETKPARPQGGEFDFTAKWFTESSVFKLAPSGLKQVIQNAKYPDWFKRANLLLAGDGGLILKTNVEGGSVGNSVWQRSATRNGEWVDAYQVVRDSWSEMNTRGGSEVIGIEMQAGAERVRRALGQENFTLVDYEDYIGRMYMRGDEPANDFERRAIEKIGEYFKKQGVDLSDTGLLPARDAMIERTAAQETTINRITTVSAAVATNSRKYVDTIIKRLATQTEKKLTLIKDLEAIQASRGLTPKQATLLSRLNDDIAEIGIRSDEMVRLDTDLSNVSDIDELLALTPRMELTSKQRALMGELATELDTARLKIQSLKSVADEMDESAKNWFPIFYNRAKILQDREGFKKLVMESYLRNPTVRVWNELEMQMDTVTLPTDAASISARADKTIAGMLDEIDDDIDEAILIGAGKGKHFLNRKLDIPREDLVDYIQTNIKDVMIAYNDRIAPRVEFAKVFSEYGKNGKAPKLADVLESMRQRLADDGLSVSEVDEAMMQFQSNYDLVVGTVYRNPDAISKKIADTLKTAATWTYLGRAGISAVADVATLFMDHKVSTVMRSLTALADDVSLKMVQREIQLSGEILDIVKNMSHARELEMLSKDVFGNKFDRVNNLFFMANGLGPVTVATKLIDGLARGHTIIEASEALVKGTLNDFDKVFLARYNITPEMALRITKMPYETSNNGLRLPNTAAWTDLEAVDAFRNALRSGVANRVISATPADKPKMMNGVAYIPMSVASKLNLPEDEVVKGFYRMENALLSLPFTFYSYSLGALNKVTANYAQGAVRNRSVHFAMAMFFGYQIVKFKTPDWAWDKMGTEDKLARAFDMSGIAALYSDIGYRSLEMAQSFGAEESFIAPKFVQEPDRLGGILSLGGAPIDWAKETADGIGDFLSGNYSDGAKQIGRQMPLTGLLILNGLGRDVTDGFAASLPNRQ